MERIFGWFLDGHPILINRSLWRCFPMIRSKRWTLGNRVLIGDAKATAHFSIGSGTKLAMEDAIALGRRLRERARRRGRAPPLRDRPPGGGGEDPARGGRVAGLVRACRPLLGLRPGPVRLRRDDARQGHHLRQPAAARPRVRGRGRPDFRAPGAGPRLRRGRRAPPRAHVPALPPARHGGPEPGRDEPDVHVLGGGGHADRLAPRPLRLPRHRRPGPALHRDDLRRPRRPHHARLHGPVDGRAGGGLAAHRRFRPRQLRDQDLPPARPCRPQRARPS